MFNVLVQRAPLDDIIQRCEIDIAPASIDLAGAELALSSAIGRERSLEKALMAKHRYDFILIDTPPSLGLLTINALTAADGVIVPVQCEYLSLRGLAQMEKTLEMIRRTSIRTFASGASCRRCLTPGLFTAAKRSKSSGRALAKWSSTVVRKTIKFAEVPVQGRSIMAYEPEGAAADTYRNLAKELLNANSSEHEGRGLSEPLPAYGAHI